MSTWLEDEHQSSFSQSFKFPESGGQEVQDKQK